LWLKKKELTDVAANHSLSGHDVPMFAYNAQAFGLLTMRKGINSYLSVVSQTVICLTHIFSLSRKLIWTKKKQCYASLIQDVVGLVTVLTCIIHRRRTNNQEGISTSLTQGKPSKTDRKVSLLKLIADANVLLSSCGESTLRTSMQIQFIGLLSRTPLLAIYRHVC